MDEQRLRDMLAAVHTGSCSVNDAVAQLRALPFEDLGFAKIDHHRAIRCGFPEVIYCEGKSAQQVAEIFDRSAATGLNVLATRASQETRDAVVKKQPNAEYHETARTITLRQQEQTPSTGTIATRY